MITPYSGQYRTLCFGTGLGFLIFWRQVAGGRFAEIFHICLGEGKEILDITLDKGNEDHVRFAVGTRCGTIQIWRYDYDGVPENLKAVKIGTTIPRKVAFAYNNNIVWVFGFYDGRLYVQTSP